MCALRKKHGDGPNLAPQGLLFAKQWVYKHLPDLFGRPTVLLHLLSTMWVWETEML